MHTFQESDLEHVASCSVCGGELEQSVLTGVRDHTFFNVAGEWSFAACVRCGSLQLDPRPSPASIHHAYASYYTHADAGEKLAATGVRESLVDRWVDSPLRSSWLGGAASVAVRPALLAGDLRSLGRATSALKVLDVGCGNGLFLSRAQRMGHQVLGIDNDEQAVLAARARGLTCEVGTIEDLVPRHESSFDLITASHVIEHVHDVAVFLTTCLRLLRPGGRLWLETPNARGWGLRLYGRNWRGLEAPRHLTLFSPRALQQLVERVGFDTSRFHWTGLVSPYTFSRSAQASRAAVKDQPMRIRVGLVASAVLLDVARAVVGRSGQEFITMTARRP